MSDWIYQTASETELRDFGKDALLASKCSSSKKNIELIENEIYKLASLVERDQLLNRKKYVCLLQEFIRDTCHLKNKTVQEVYKLYQAANRTGARTPDELVKEGIRIGWNSELFDEARMQEELEIETMLKPPAPIEPGVIPCRRCGQKNTRSTAKQIRRGDESSTEFYTCFNPECNYTWRE